MVYNYASKVDKILIWLFLCYKSVQKSGISSHVKENMVYYFLNMRGTWLFEQNAVFWTLVKFTT